MKVRILGRITGLREGVEWPQVGETLDVPEDEARQLVGMGVVELAADEPAAKQERKPRKPKPETATAPAPEIATAPAPEKD